MSWSLVSIRQHEEKPYSTVHIWPSVQFESWRKTIHIIPAPYAAGSWLVICLQYHTAQHLFPRKNLSSLGRYFTNKKEANTYSMCIIFPLIKLFLFSFSFFFSFFLYIYVQKKYSSHKTVVNWVLESVQKVDPHHKESGRVYRHLMPDKIVFYYWLLALGVVIFENNCLAVINLK